MIGDDTIRRHLREGVENIIGERIADESVAIPLVGKYPGWVKYFMPTAGFSRGLVESSQGWLLVDAPREWRASSLLGKVVPDCISDVKRGAIATRFTLENEKYWVYRGFRSDFEGFLAASTT